MEERIREIFNPDCPDLSEGVQCDYCENQIQAILTAVAESQVTRFEVIDHTKPLGSGRVFTRWLEEPFSVKLSYQDDGRTLKVFLAQLGKEVE